MPLRGDDHRDYIDIHGIASGRPELPRIHSDVLEAPSGPPQRKSFKTGARCSLVPRSSQEVLRRQSLGELVDSELISTAA